MYLLALYVLDIHLSVLLSFAMYMWEVNTEKP